MKPQNITVHIKYNNEMTIFDLQDSLSVLSDAFALFYEKEHVPLSEKNEISPKVAGISEGSFMVDVIVPVACAMLPIIYDLIKTAYKNKKQYTVSVGKTRTTWTDADNYEISKAVLKEYAIRKTNKSIEDFIDSLSLPNIYKRGAIRNKIQNTKHLMQEQNIPNSLSVAPLRHCSQAHRVQFKQACRDLGI